MNIRVDLNTSIKDGTEVVFRSPVDCSQITGLIVYYNDNGNTTSKEFALADAHGNNVGDIDHLFAENVVVKVILDVTTSMAFVQNADTNAYLEGRFAELEKKIDQGGTGGGGSIKPLNVTIDFDTMRASHTASEIYEHKQKGGFAYCEGIPLRESYESEAYFFSIANTNIGTEEETCPTVQITVGADGTVIIYESRVALLADSFTAPGFTWSSQKIATEIGSIETALDGIITIQNSLIGGGSV